MRGVRIRQSSLNRQANRLAPVDGLDEEAAYLLSRHHSVVVDQAHDVANLKPVCGADCGGLRGVGGGPCSKACRLNVANGDIVVVDQAAVGQLDSVNLRQAQWKRLTVLALFRLSLLIFLLENTACQSSPAFVDR